MATYQHELNLCRLSLTFWTDEELDALKTVLGLVPSTIPPGRTEPKDKLVIKEWSNILSQPADTLPALAHGKAFIAASTKEIILACISERLNK